MLFLLPVLISVILAMVQDCQFSDPCPLSRLSTNGFTLACACSWQWTSWKYEESDRGNLSRLSACVDVIQSGFWCYGMSSDSISLS